MASERFGAPAEWSDDQVNEAVWMLRLGRSCAHVADCMRVIDEVVVRMGWALRATGVDVQGLFIWPQRPQLTPAPRPAARKPRFPAHLVPAWPRERALALS